MAQIIGTAGAETLVGTADADTIIGDAGDDILIGQAGADLTDGGLGDDVHHVDDPDDLVVEQVGEGNDRVNASVGYALAGTAEVETLATDQLAGTTAISLTGNGFANNLYGNHGANYLSSGGGNDVLIGHGGGDILIGGGGIDTASGGAGDDLYHVDDAGDLVFESAGEGNDRVNTSVSYVLAASAEVETLSTDHLAGTAAIDLFGNGFANALYGNTGANYLSGGGGNDLLIGHGGDDILIGGAGNDTASGGVGDDIYYVDESGDLVFEGAGQGNDRVNTSVSYLLATSAEVETLSTDHLAGTAAIDLFGNGFANNLYGNAGANYLSGGGGGDVLISHGGNDILIGGAGIDTMAGGAGDDIYYVDQASDIVIESAGEGNDRVNTGVSYALAGAAEIETLSTDQLAGTVATDLFGNDFDNAVYGNQGANYLSGRGGNDLLIGHGGNDILIGGGGIDTASGGVGNDSYYIDDAADIVIERQGEGSDRVFAGASYTLAAHSEVETLSTDQLAGTVAIDLTGNGFANNIYGNAGANALDGGGGNDVLIGNGGGDRYRFTSELGAGNVDAIVGFVPGDDRIELGAVFTGLATGFIASHAFTVGAAATDAFHRILYDPTSGALLFDEDGAGGIAPVRFATIGSNRTDLDGFDFWVLGAPNNSPVVTSAVTASITENSEVSTVLYTATASDVDGDAIVFDIWGEDADKFTIDPVSGELRLRAPADFETEASYQLTVGALDSAGGGAKDLTITVTDVPDTVTPAVAETTTNNDGVPSAQSIDRSLLEIADNLDLHDDSLPSATIEGVLSSNFDRDFFAIHLEQGELLVLDIDDTPFALDALVTVYAPGGVEIGSNDDGAFVFDPGSSNEFDSFLKYRAETTGTFYFSVGSFDSESSGAYELHVSVGPPSSDIDQENIDAMLSGLQWGFGNLTYSFPTRGSDYPIGSHDGEIFNNFEAFNAIQQGAVRLLLGDFAAVANLSFTERSSDRGSANLRYAMSDQPEGAYAYLPSGPLGGASWYNNSSGEYDQPVQGNYAYFSFLHETGHALGLKHSHEFSPVGTGRDSMEFTVMSYRSYTGGPVDGAYSNETFGYAQTLMIYDIAALQQIYGANFNTNAGDSLYRWNELTGEMTINGARQGAPGANRILMTVWDGGGNDTYDLSNYGGGVLIDLRPGEWTTTSQIQLANLGDGRAARGNTANALQHQDDARSLIENAIGGAGADELIANAAANRLTGGGGADNFIFRSAEDVGIGTLADTLTDFVSGLDEIILTGIDANAATPEDDSFRYIGSNAFSSRAGELRSESVGSQTHLLGDLDGDGIADLQIIISAPAITLFDITL